MNVVPALVENFTTQLINPNPNTDLNQTGVTKHPNQTLTLKLLGGELLHQSPLSQRYANPLCLP